MAKKKYKKTIYPAPPYGRSKVGRYKFVNNKQGKPINDLGWNKANGVYYYIPDRSKTFGVKYGRATGDFEIFISALNGSIISKPDDKESFRSKATIQVTEECAELLKKYSVPLVVTAFGHYVECHSFVTSDEGYELRIAGSACIDLVNMHNFINSYPPETLLEIEAKKAEVIICTVDNPGECQKNAIVDIEFEPIDYTFTKTQELCRIDKSIFVEGMRKINFAIGYEPSRPDFNRQLCQVKQDEVRFTTGTGARFAIMSYRGNGIVSFQEEVTVSIPDYSIANVLACTKKAIDKDITIQKLMPRSDDQHLIIRYDHTQIIIFQKGGLHYPPFDNVLKRDYSYQFKCDFDQFKHAVAGLRATNTLQHQEVSPRHTAFLDLDLIKGKIILSSATNVSSTRSLPIRKVIRQSENLRPRIKISTEYLLEVANKGPKSKGSLMTISIENQPPEEKTPPILVEFPKVVNKKRGTTERFVMFFFTVYHRSISHVNSAPNNVYLLPIQCQKDKDISSDLQSVL